MPSHVIAEQAWGDQVTDSSTTAKYPLGQIRWELDGTVGLKAYRYVQAGSAIAANDALSHSDLYNRVATTDISAAAINQVCGVGISTIAASSYGWVQCYGYYEDVATDAGDDFADGDWVILHASTDGVADRTASGTAAVSKPLGYAVAADVDADDTVATFLTCI